MLFLCLASGGVVLSFSRLHSNGVAFLVHLTKGQAKLLPSLSVCRPSVRLSSSKIFSSETTEHIIIKLGKNDP